MPLSVYKSSDETNDLREMHTLSCVMFSLTTETRVSDGVVRVRVTIQGASAPFPPRPPPTDTTSPRDRRTVLKGWG